MTIWDEKFRERKAAAQRGRRPTDLANATHEASHAVVAHVMGLDVKSITLESTWRGEGSSEQTMWADLVTCMAGMCGVARLYEKESADNLLNVMDSFCDDMYTAESILQDVASHDKVRRIGLFGQAIFEASRIVASNWSHIQSIAKELVELDRTSNGKKELKGTRLKSILKSVPRESISV